MAAINKSAQFSMAPIKINPGFLSLPQAQQLYGVSRSFLYQLRSRGELKFHYIATKPFIKVEDFEKLMTIEA